MPWTTHTGTSNSTAGAQALTVDKPTGVVAGSVVCITIVFAATHGGITAPATFTVTEETTNRWSGYRICGGSEPATYDFTWVTSRAAVMVATAATPTGSATFSDGQIQSNSTTTTHPSDDITVGADAWLTAHWTVNNAGGACTWTISDLTEQSDLQSGTGPCALSAVGTQAAAGATGAKTATASATVTGRCTYWGFYSPAGGGGKIGAQRGGGRRSYRYGY
jgi:hypothetical protein